MTQVRRILVGISGLTLVLLVSVLLSEKPDLYRDVSFSTAIHARDGTLLRIGLAQDQRYRLFTPYADLPQHGIKATLVYEDRWFWHHPGVNPLSLFRAAWSTFITRERAIGASTITMQLARLHFKLHTTSIRGKFSQIWHAFVLERHYTKEQILEAYLNLAPYGGNVEGIGTAALIYFDNSPDQLSFQQATALAVIPQNPSKRKPGSTSGNQKISEARERLVALWQEQYELDPEQLALTKLPLSFRRTSELPFHAPHFVLRHQIETPIVKSTLDINLQKLIERKIHNFVEQQEHLGISNASAMLINHETMQLLASVGSADFSNRKISGQVDGTLAKRSPGSTLKPFVYGLAMDAGLIHPKSLMKDAPRRFGVYTPENFDRGFMGPVTAQDALIYSRNVPAINLLAQVGQAKFHRFLVNAGVADLQSPEHYGLSMILGGNEVTMQELSTLYAILANGGIRRKLQVALPATPKQVYSSPIDSPKPQEFDESSRLISAEASYLLLDMLGQNPRPDRLSIDRQSDQPTVAWKTGTSYAYRDAWSVGVVGPYVVTVWVGNFDGTGNPALVGRKAAAPLFFDIVDALTKESSLTLLPAKSVNKLNLREVEICSTTGDLPNQYCPSVSKSWFIPGVSPIKSSNVYRPVWVNNKTGKRACRAFAKNTSKKVYEFWPSDIDLLFKQAGISTRQPPEWDADCLNQDRSMLGQIPQITSPIERVTYPIKPGTFRASTITFTATTDADVSNLYWFVDDQFIAKSERDEAILWQAQTGEHTVSVVDDLGRSNSNRIRVTSVPQ